jgi:hypothetical protein
VVVLKVRPNREGRCEHETSNRPAVVEYRVEQHATILRDRLAALRAAQSDSENDSVLARTR